MSKSADAAREMRWKVRGHTRLTARISGRADDALTLLAAHFRLSRREVVEALLLAASASVQGEPCDVTAAIRDHGLSRGEAEFYASMRGIGEAAQSLVDAS